MPADSRRKATLDALAAKIRTATGASYFFDLSGAVSTKHDSGGELRAAGLPVVVQITEGDEACRNEDLSASVRSSAIAFLVDLLVMARGTNTIETDFNQALADVRRVLDSDPTLGGVTSDMLVAQIAQPDYRPDDLVASTTLTVVCRYEWVRGQVGAPSGL